MSQRYIPLTLRNLVHHRAKHRCEYCLVSDQEMFFKHQIDHIIAEQHGGETNAENLALACIECNRYKGPNIASLDSETGQITRLYNPRTDDWSEHLVLQNIYIIPLTAIGRATTHLLRFNSLPRLRMRQTLSTMGRYP